MKQLILLILPVLVFTASCKKTQVVPNKTIVVNVPSVNWSSVDGGRSFTTAIDVPELDDPTHERAGVLTYISFGDRVYEQIPQVYNGDAYSFVTQPGEVVLEVQRYDGVGFVSRPAGSTVKIVIVYSEI